MLQRLVRIYRGAWRLIVALFTIEIAIVSALRYFTDRAPPPPPVLANGFANPFLVLHVIGGIVALICGPLQFVRGIRDRWPAFHRATGRTYVGGCLIGAPAGLMLALGTTAGPVASVGFAIPAILWPVFTWLGVRAAIARRLSEHREWMLRSYAITATAITLRLMLPASALLGFDFLPAYRLIAWLGWCTNLALVELGIRRTRASPTTFAAFAAA
jgi:uncharacterized membrane protein